MVRTDSAAQARQLPDIDPRIVAAELGIEASDRLVGRNYIILVEGSRDVEFYGVVLAHLHSAGETSLDPAQVLFLQCGGIGNLRYVTTTCCIDDAGLTWAVIADSDRTCPGGPLGAQAQALQDNCPASCSYMAILDRTTIENYLDPVAVKAVTGIDCLVPEAGRPTDLTGGALPNFKTIKENGAAIAQQMGAAGIIAHSLDGSGSSEFVRIFEEIRMAFGL